MNKFAEIKQYKHKMLQNIFFFFFFTFEESTCPLIKVKEIYRNKPDNKPISNNEPQV